LDNSFATLQDLHQLALKVGSKKAGVVIPYISPSICAGV